MDVLLRATVRPLVATLLLAFLLSGSPVEAQTQSAPTQEQLQMFQNLPPEQQRAVLESMQQGGSQDWAQPAQAAPGTDASQAGREPTGAANRSAERRIPAEVAPARATAHATVILDVAVREEQPADLLLEEKARIESRRDQIRGGNPFRLDDEGQLHLPLLAPIALGGLTDKEAARLLNADPRLDGLRFTVTLLPVKAVGSEALQPFGYALFKEDRNRFAPAIDLAVPAGYVLGPGDNVSVELFGKKTARYRLTVNRDGALSVPELGPIQASGMSFDELRSEIEQRVNEQMIGVRASVTMGQLRSLRVFVVGDVLQPGSHSVSSMSTITGALFASGGVSEVGSLRNIELKRGGATVTRFDLYDLLLRGDTSRDLQLRQGDAIFVPPVGLTAGVVGQVRRPAIYEFRDGARVSDLVQLAGGLKPDSAMRAAKLERIEQSGERSVLDIDLSSPADLARPLRSGDVITVPKVLNEYAGAVTLEGHVHRPGPYAWRPGLRLSDVLGGLQALKLNADQRYIVIRRERMPDRRIEVMSADAVAAFAAKGTAADPPLESRDRVIVFSRQADRGVSLAALLDEMRMQSRDNQPVPIVSVNGRIRAPGNYPYEPNMTVSDLVRAGGGMDDAAYALKAELTRYKVINGETRQTEVINLDLAGVSGGNIGADIAVQPYDVLVIQEVPDWREQESVMVRGEVRFPGTYPIRQGETLSSLIARAGGLTEAAYPAGSVFMREELKTQEREQLETLANRLQSDLTLLALQSAQTKDQQIGETLSAGQAMLQQLRSAEAKGRLVIDLDRALARQQSEDDIQLRGGDTLLVPRLKQYVTVIGEVQNSTSHVWKSDRNRDDYIAMSGGTTRRADDDRTYVVRANGSVVSSEGNSWFSGSGENLEPGSTVVVPIDAERMRPLPLWTAVTTIIYNLAIAAAAVNSF